MKIIGSNVACSFRAAYSFRIEARQEHKNYRLHCFGRLIVAIKTIFSHKIIPFGDLFKEEGEHKNCYFAISLIKMMAEMKIYPFPEEVNRTKLTKVKTSNSANKKTIILVDALSSGSLYFQPDIKKDFNLINLYSKETVSEYRDHPNDNTKGIYYTGLDTIKLLKEINPSLITVASDFGVIKYHEVIEHFPNMMQNDPSLRLARVDKFEMQKRIGDLGIPSKLISSLEEANKTLSDFFKKQPSRKVMIKPLKDGGSKDTAFFDIHDFKKGRIQEFITRVLGSTGTYGVVNNQLLIQSFVQGPEVVVNSMTISDKTHPSLGIKGAVHITTDIYQYYKQTRKHSQNNLYHLNVHIDENDPCIPALLEFRGKVLDRLGYLVGPSHMEAIFDIDEKKWVLVEVAERIAGSLDSVSGDIATSCSPAKSGIDSFFNPQKLLNDYPNKIYKTKKNVVLFSFISDKNCKINRKEMEVFLRSLPSYTYHKISKSDTCTPTLNLDNIPGAVVLSHLDRSTIEKDLNALSVVEKKWFGCQNPEITSDYSNRSAVDNMAINWNIFIPST